MSWAWGSGAIVAGASDVRTAVFAENFLQRATVSYSVSNCLTADGQKRGQNISTRAHPPTRSRRQQTARPRLKYRITRRLRIDPESLRDVLDGLPAAVCEGCSIRARDSLQV